MKSADEYGAILSSAVPVIRHAGNLIQRSFSHHSRIGDMSELMAGIHANDTASTRLLREPLSVLRPQAGWVEDEEDEGALPEGEWWVVDPVEGNVNHIHGMMEWGITAALVRNNEAVLAIVHLPLIDQTYTAVRGHGAFLNGMPIRVSAKSDLRAGLVGTGQGKPHESPHILRQIGRSVTAMLEAALVVRVLVPATLTLIHVAAGRMDAFWQYGQVRAGLLAGALLIEEAGGVISDTQGKRWTLHSKDFLAAAPGVQAAAVQALSPLA